MRRPRRGPGSAAEPARRREGPLTRGSPWLPLALLLIIVLGGSWLRLVDLGQPDFYNDELYMVYAARSLERGEGPALPSGELYRRGRDITRMVGFSLRHMDHPETAARLPSALFGILGLVLFTGLAWAVAGPWPAVWAGLLLAIYPEAISQSRITRFYTYQLVFGIVALYAGWRAVESAGRDVPGEDRWRRLRSDWAWALAAALALALAVRVQSTTYSIAAAWMACMGLGALADLAKRGRRAVRDSARVQTVLLGSLALIAAAAIRPEAFQRLIVLSQAVPEWAGGVPAEARAYYWGLVANFPVIVTLLPVCVLVAAFRNPRLTAFLGLWFALPFALHSLLLPWKAERYILLAMPALFLIVGIAAAAGCAEIFRRTRLAAERAGAQAPTARWGAAGIVAVAAGVALFTTPAFNVARKVPPFVVDLHWRTADALIRDLPDADRVVIGSSYPINALYYWERADFGVSTASLERKPLPDDPRTPTVGPWVRYDDGVPDYYTAVPVITRPGTIRDRFGQAPAAVIAVDRAHMRFGHIDPGLAETLEREAIELCDGGCGRLLLFYWPLAAGSDLIHPTSPGADALASPVRSHPAGAGAP